MSDTMAASQARLIVEAREALRRRDATRLAALRSQVIQSAHPLASWVDYWELTQRLSTARVDEVEGFYERWRGRYVEDRLRNDWLQELGRRRDWPAFSADFPRFRMNDDREVTCYALLTQHLAGKPVKAAAVDAWMEQRDADDGCHLLASTLLEAKVIDNDVVWTKVRTAVDMGRMRAARHAASLISPDTADTVQEIVQQPLRYLNAKGPSATRRTMDFIALALARVAAADPEFAAEAMRDRWASALPPALAAWTWGQVGEQAAQKMQVGALEHFKAAFAIVDAQSKKRRLDVLSDETLAFAVRAALRTPERARWTWVARAIDAMRGPVAADPSWVYWRARATMAQAAPGADGDGQRESGRQTLRQMAGQWHFYGALAAEDLGQRFALPPRPAPLSAVELQAARQHPGLRSALQMIAAGLREEGVREWNFSLRGMSDRELLAASQWACERQVWDRCINTSDRTRELIDVDQRYPMPFRRELLAKSRERSLDPAYVYGLIRQESRFITDARSHVGAAGLMQLMPATARWTAKKIGVNFTQNQVTDPSMNLALGTEYLKLVLEDFGGSMAMAAAAYNAGPSRPRRWREGTTIEAAAWAESIPFHETRDYVKKVLKNSVVYSALMGNESSLKGRLGGPIGPREAASAAPNRELP